MSAATEETCAFTEEIQPKCSAQRCLVPFQMAPNVDAKRLTLVRETHSPEPAGETGGAFALAVRDGLCARPKTLPCAYFYDEVGSALFEQNLPTSRVLSNTHRRCDPQRSRQRDGKGLVDTTDSD